MLTRDLQVISEFAPSAPATAGRRTSGAHAWERFELDIATSYYDRPDLLEAWNAMLATAASPEKMYQSPAFFSHVVATHQGGTVTHELFVARRRTDNVIVGFVPVRVITRDLAFRFGPVALFKRPVRVLQLLGSIPLLDPAEDGLGDFVMRQLLARHPECQAIYMQAVPQELGNSWDAMAGLSTYVLNGWRDCHTQPLPDSVDAYLQKFSAKKRYNLSRQVRMLEKEVGALQVLRIQQPEQVGTMLDAIGNITPARKAERASQQPSLESMARQGLLLSYVIRCGNEDVAVVHGAQSNGVWHVYNIAAKQQYLHLSAGTSATHLALQDVLANFSLSDVDFHYGTPNQEFRSTHVMKTRGHVMLFRSHSLSSLLLKTHEVYDGLNEGLIRQVKLAKKKLEERKKAAAAKAKAKTAEAKVAEAEKAPAQA